MIRSIGILIACLAALTGPALADVTLVHAGRLLAVPGAAPLGPSTLVIRDGVIDRVESGFLEMEGGDEVVTIIDLRDQFVLPGLIDAHVHLAFNPDDTRLLSLTEADTYFAIVATANARTTLEAGFTTVRDLGSAPDTVHALRAAIRRGVVPGPRIQSAGAAMAIVGGHGDVSGLRRDVMEAVYPAHVTMNCTGAVECTKRVREISKYGADLIKITATGGVLSQQSRGLDQHFFDTELKAIMDAAHALGLKVAAHAHGDGGIAAVVRAGVDSVDHGTFTSAESARLMARNGTFMVPTLMAFRGTTERLGTGLYTPVVEAKIRVALKVLGHGLTTAHAAGVKIAFGTDSGVFDHGRNAEEFQMMVDHGGMTPAEAIHAATVNGADLMGLADQIGTLEAGKAADLIAVTGDPLGDVSLLESVSFVMKGGVVYKQ